MLAVGGHILGETNPQLVRMVTPFVGGVACDHEDICGAFVAGLLCIGLVHGRDQTQEADQPAYVLARRYRTWFLDTWGTTQCGPIRDCVRAPGGTGSCRYTARDAALRLLELLQENAPAPAGDVTQQE
jgi:hypothetical protein